jgi:hypothetical protein
VEQPILPAISPDGARRPVAIAPVSRAAPAVDDRPDRPFPHEARPVGVARELFCALALADGPAPAAWLHCRAAAHRYLDAARRERIRPDVALRLLTDAVRRWAAPELDAAARVRLATALPVWVGTAYGLRWRATGRAGRGTVHPRPGTAVEARGAMLRAQCEALVARHRAHASRVHRAGTVATTAADRSRQLCLTARAVATGSRAARTARADGSRQPGGPPAEARGRGTAARGA